MIDINLNKHSVEDVKAIRELKEMGVPDDVIQKAYDNTQERRKAGKTVMQVFDALREKLGKLICHDNNRKTVYLEDAIEIVNQVEQEFGHPTICYLDSPCEYQTEDVNHNHGWIPCSERLPEEDDAYLVTLYSEYYKQYEVNLL